MCPSLVSLVHKLLIKDTLRDVFALLIHLGTIGLASHTFKNQNDCSLYILHWIMHINLISMLK